MKMILAGCGKIGLTLTRQLAAEGHDLTVIDADQTVLDACAEQYDVMSVCGNCAVKDSLERAGVADADLLIAMTGTDEVNLLCCMTAHSLNPKLHTIARIRNPAYSDQVYAMRDLFALSLTFNPDRQAATEIERLLKYPGFLKLDTFARGRVEIAELRVDAASPLKDLSLSDIYRRIRIRVLVCAVLRDGEVIMPSGASVLREGDRIFVTAPSKSLSALLHELGILSRKVKSVLIAGGGRTSYYLASQLADSGMSVKIIENDPGRCQQLAELLPGATVIHGDASSQTLLESEGLNTTDALVALTGMDEINMVIALYGSGAHVRQVVTKLGRVENSEILNALPLGSIISPRELSCSGIIRYVRAMENQAGAATAVHFIADGKAEAVEFRVDSATAHCGEALKAIRLRKNVLVACITHAGQTEIPCGDSCFRAGDTVIIVTARSNPILTLNDIFED